MKPEMKILSVSMNENIASSGNNEDIVIKEIVHQKSGTLSSKWEKYNYLVNPESRTIFDTEKPEEVRAAERWVNNYPRKLLGWKSAAMLFEKELLSA